MTNLKSENKYEFYDGRHDGPHHRKCIDDTITGSSKCVAYCENKIHPGFLTEKLRVNHQCLEKECDYYLPKPTKSKRVVCGEDDKYRQLLMEMVISATRSMEGLRVMRASQDAEGRWVFYYVAISDYAFDEIIEEMEEWFNEKFVFEKMNSSFDISAALIFGVKPTTHNAAGNE